MNAPNAAVGALPGWRGTDPDGGTWVRRAEDAIYPWHEIDARGELYWRPQEEAEAASLVPLVSQAHVDDLKKAWQEHIESVRDQRDSLASDLSSANDEIARLADAAPAPLDPGNPEHLREVDKFLGRFYASIGMASSSAGSVCKQLRSVADRLDRERAEAEQDSSDRKLAEEWADKAHPSFSRLWPATRDGFLAGIRAGRAERQEAGQ